MQERNRQAAEELYWQMSKARSEQEERERNAEAVIKRETELDRDMQQTYLKLEQMRETCSPADHTLQQIIDEGLDAMNRIRKQRFEFLDSLQIDRKKQARKHASEMDEIRALLRKLEKEDKEAERRQG